jgi:hypothetical protein
MNGVPFSSDERDPILVDFFRSDAIGAAPPDLLGRTLDVTRNARRSPAWSARVGQWLDRSIGPRYGRRLRTVAILAVLAAIVAATLWWTVLGGASHPTPGPLPGTILVERFARPFTYVDDPLLQRFTPDDNPPVGIVAWVDGVDIAAAAPEPRPFGGQENTSGATSGIIVASAGADTWTHRCGPGGGRQTIRFTPLGFMTDLRDVEGAGFDEFQTVLVDGREAVAATLSDTRSRCATDVHFVLGVVGQPYVSLGLPARMLAVDVDGVTVVIQIWSRDDKDLASWLPAANAFVDRFHFLPPK